MSDKPTREQILNNPGGDQFNRWLVENVMKWNEIDDDGSWSPSTHIADTMELVLKMADNGWWMRLNIFPNSNPILWECLFHTRPLSANSVVVEAVAETAPLAISRAIMLVVIDER